MANIPVCLSQKRTPHSVALTKVSSFFSLKGVVFPLSDGLRIEEVGCNAYCNALSGTFVILGCILTLIFFVCANSSSFSSLINESSGRRVQVKLVLFKLPNIANLPQGALQSVQHCP